MAGNAMPLLLRLHVIDAVLEAQSRARGPVTAAAVREVSKHAALSSARAFTELATRVSKLGADELGRTLHHAGEDRAGRRLWWVETTEAAG
jgi:hypothetical protein